MPKNTITSMFVGTFPQLLAALTVTISAISDGMQYGWSAPVIPILQTHDSPVKITSTDESWLETIYLLGSISSLPVTIYLVDRIGRKKSIMAASCTSFIAWILIGVANNVIYLYVGRFCAGVAGDVAFVAAPMYIAEIADQKIRGFLSGLIYLMMLLGILLVYSIAPYVPFYVPSIVGGTILCIQLLTFQFVPDSPYYLIMKGKREEAELVLNKLRPNQDNKKELQNIETAMEEERSDQARPQDLVLQKNNRWAMIIITALNGGQHFCGITVIMMNLHSILEEAESIYMSVTTTAIIFAAIMLISATVSSFIVDQYGRKILLILSSSLTGICMAIIAIYFNVKNSGMNVSDLSWIPVASIMVYAAVFKFGLGMVPIVMTAELFSSNVKAIGMSVGDTVYILSGLISVQLYQWTAPAYGYQVPFYIFAACSLFMALFSAFCVPETKGKTLEEIQILLKGESLVNEKSSNYNSIRV